MIEELVQVGNTPELCGETAHHPGMWAFTGAMSVKPHQEAWIKRLKIKDLNIKTNIALGRKHFITFPLEEDLGSMK